MCRHDDDFAVDHDAVRELFEEHLVQLRKVAIERSKIAALNIDVVLASKNYRAKAIPFRFVQESAARRQRVGQLGEHRLDRWLNGRCHKSTNTEDTETN